MKAIARTPAQTISAWSENGRPRRMWATIQPMEAAATMAIPPIVGVPCLAMWCSGPRSSLPRIGWPSPRVRNAVIRKRVSSSDRIPATIPAIMTAINGGAPNDDTVVERQHLITDRLCRLVALAGDDHHVGGACARRAPGRSPPGGPARPPPSAVRCRHAVDHVGDDGGGILRTRVVRCHHHVIGEPCRHRAHRRPLGVIAITAATEHDEHAAGSNGARGGEDLLDAVRRVGIVDDHDRAADRAPRSARSGRGRHQPRRARRRCRRHRCRARRRWSPRRASWRR